jgi:hypothetical protein
MIEKMSRLAENAGASVSRRGFLGWLGAGAMAVAGLLVGSVGQVQAAHVTCCKFTCGTVVKKSCHTSHAPCKKPKKGCKVAQATAANCKACPA